MSRPRHANAPASGRTDALAAAERSGAYAELRDYARANRALARRTLGERLRRFRNRQADAAEAAAERVLERAGGVA